LRGLAVLLVVAYHAGLGLPGGFIGVDVFYVISGFVITKMLLSELETTRGLRLQQFYLRRVRRLLPALAATSIGVAAIAVVACPFGAQNTAAFTGIAASLFSANGYLYRSIGYFLPAAELNPLLHTWSLSVEEQFYFVFPSLLLLCWRAPGAAATAQARRFTAVVVMTMVCALSFWMSCRMTLGQTIMRVPGAPRLFAFYSSPTRAWEFGVGVLIAFIPVSIAGANRLAAIAAGGAGLALVVYSAMTFGRGTPFPGIAALAPVAGTALLVWGGGAGGLGVARPLSTRAMVWVGDHSYSWYLWHWPVIVFSRALFPNVPYVSAAAAAVSLVPAWASYRFIENPFRFVRQPSRRSTLFLVAGCISAPIVACGGLLLVHRAILATSTGRSYAEAVSLHADETDCKHSSRSMPFVNCTWTVPGSRGSILLVGDSNAAQFTEPVVRAGNSAGYDVTLARHYACPFVDLTIDRNGVPDDSCRSFVNAVLASIERRPPNLIVLATASDQYIEDRTYALHARTATVASADDKAQLFAEALRSVLERMSRASRVLVVNPVPRFPNWSLEACSSLDVLLHPAACGADALRASVQLKRRRAVESERSATAQVVGAVTLDVTDQLCDSLKCSTAAEQSWVFRDGGHLSVRGAIMLTDQFAGAIAQLARQ
jgi:peptidoglycan/LPS O-acetylase OafA/YrhL